MLRKLLTTLTLFIFTAFVYCQDTYVFFGSYNWEIQNEGIYVYKLDTLSGKICKISSIRNIVNPSYITLSPDGRYLYACTETKTPGAGSISSFAFDKRKGTLNFLNSQSSIGENPVYLMVHPNGKWLVNGNYTESGITLHYLNYNGSIATAVQHIDFVEGSVNPERQKTSHIHSTVFSQNGEYLFCSDLGSDKIRIFNFEKEAKTPIKFANQPFVTTKPGSGPRHFAFHPNGNFAYSIEEMGGNISIFKYFDETLTLIDRVAAHDDTLKGGFESSDVHVSPDGKFLYAANRGQENNIAIFSISADGRLTLIAHQSTYGLQPRTFAISPNGKFLIVTNVNSSLATVFRRNIVTGLLTKTDDQTINNVSCVKFLQ